MNLSLALYASETMADKLITLLKAGGGPYASDTLQRLTSFDEILSKATEVLPDTLLVLLHVTDVTDEYTSFLSKVSLHPQMALLVLSDSSAVLSAARDQGIVMAVSAASLSSHLLEDMLGATVAAHHLRYQQTKLQGLLDLANHRFRDMADQFADWLWETDSNLVLTFSSARKRPAQSATKGSSITSCFLPEEKLRIEDDFAELIRNPRPFHERDYWALDPYGTRVCWSVSGVPVHDAEGNLVGFRGIAKDVSVAKSATDQLYHLVHNDSLTGLSNRNRAYDELVRTLRAAKREGRTGALLVLDVDRFGAVNQTHGHTVGDKLLIHIAQALKDNIRTGDMLARLDGDQFAILFRDLRAEDLDARLERLTSSLAGRPMQIEKGSLPLNLTGGAALYPEHADNADDLLTFSLSALRLAKDRLPGATLRYDAKTVDDATLPNKLEWVEFVTECLNDEQARMVLHYQPIVPLVEKPIQGASWPEFYEVLVRMVDREGQLVAPGRFLATAEEYGMLPKIDRLVTLRAIDMLEYWHQTKRKVHLSVNLSPKSFEDATFMDAVAQRLESANLPEGALVFEITETAILRDLPTIKAFMDTMKKYGASFALDDCGVGYSSFNTIRHLPLSYIKIDGSFVQNLKLGTDDEVFIKALADVAKQKNIATVAEMVEHETALKALKSLGVDYAQGFFFAPPAADLPEPGAFSADRWDA